MSAIQLNLTEEEALSLYRLIHRVPGGEDEFCEAYRQLQLHFFRTLTVEEVTQLLDGDR